jgi:hypothetical protein
MRRKNKMKFASIDFKWHGSSVINIGNEIQTIAAQQQLPRIDHVFCWWEMNNKKRKEEGLEELKEEEILCIFNGFVNIWDCSQFPPEENITPLMISSHLVEANMRLLKKNPKVLNWLKRYEPIGCRDKSTLHNLEELGVKAYFSGCLTLTLDRKDFSYPKQKRKGVFFVDAPLDFVPNRLWHKKIRCIQHNYPQKHGHLYRGVLSDFISVNNIFAELMFSFTPRSKRNYFKYKIKLANYLLSLYANAEFVATTRLHVALPCLAFGTPVLFIYKSPEENKDYPGCCPLEDPRFSGLTTDYVTRIDSVSFRSGLKEGRWFIDGKMTHWDEIKNPDTHLEIADMLRARVRKAISP